ncbi:hypothetical protein E1B28_010190 [Marasmius oreades]|uniref:BZIP domain-containing protein n=1 Tax=Marasmius oreades TaxID=181124 RepID=A0A9P7RWK7_9AGAR|nr:uncharacterized protein E1B28_010190 [Marasmius oreades]KAG7091136.1 hypothetical protein E1B28_010190 [Marasmius oreades]
MCKQNPPPLQMSQIIAADAPLLSPGSEWADRHPQDTSHFYSQYAHYHQLPPSPPVSVAGSLSTDSPRMLKTRMSPDAVQMCLPTHQLFDLGELPHAYQAPPSPALSDAKDFNRASIKPPTIPTSMKRSESPANLSSAPAPKRRTIGERISTKDFIPPDVSGLSKREARLVKNRAAAFLSRQRKREEFETMEGRVLELEQENARLLALTQSDNLHSLPNTSTTSSDPQLLCEIENLKAELAAARDRERQLMVELSSKSSHHSNSTVKVESSDEFNSSLASSPRVQPVKGTSSAASLGLMVLLCTLPSLLSIPAASSLPAKFSLPSSPIATPTSFDFSSWSVDSERPLKSNKLEFVGDSGIIDDLNSLDVSFDTVPSENGKIRVRIHPTSSTRSRSTSPGTSFYSSSPNHPTASSSLGLDLWGQGASEASSFDPSFPSPSASSFSSYPSANADPFLGIAGPTNSDFSSSFSSLPSQNFHQSNHLHVHQPSPSGSASPSSTLFGGGELNSYHTMSSPDFGIPFDYLPHSKRRVRIALKSMPETPAHGSEWEVVSVC